MKKRVVGVSLGVLYLCVVAGCAHRQPKPDAEAPPVADAGAATADTATAPVPAGLSDEERFREAIQLVHKLNEKPATAGAAPPDVVAGASAPAPASAPTKPAAAAPAAKSAAPSPSKRTAPSPSKPTVPSPAAPVPPPPAAAAPAVAPPAPRAQDRPKTPKAAEPALPPPLDTASAAAPQVPSQDAAPQIGAPQVADAIQLMISHPRVNYRSATGRYSYFAGGLVDAEYDTNSNALLLRSDRPGTAEQLQCRYSGAGLAPDGSEAPDRASACAGLLKTLVQLLQR